MTRRAKRPVWWRPEPNADATTDLLAALIRARGTEDARDVVMALREPLRSAEWPAAETVIRLVQALGDAGEFDDDERIYLIAGLVDEVVPSRAGRDPRFAEVEREMREVEQRHGLGPDDAFILHKAPDEYQRLNAEWERIADREVADWLSSLGEREMAGLLRRDRGEYEARVMEGAATLFGQG